MRNIGILIDSNSQHINDSNQGDNVYFSTIDLKYAYSQLKLHPDTSCHCNFNIICGDSTGTYRFKAGFYCLTDMPAVFQKAMDYKLVALAHTYCFLDDIIVVSKDSITFSKNGVKPIESKTAAKAEIKAPKHWNNYGHS